MKIILTILLTFHGLIHLMGFVKGFGLAEIPELTLPISQTGGILWLLSAVLFIIFTLFLLTEYMIWWKIALAGLILSQSLIIYSWQDAKFGSAANIFIGLAILVVL
ncbi:MAG TPA: hypothetical protein DD671_03890, partial [Balneolaceae bacterium]|nr:hypothetical protein [Balneolaceae bacterium]